MTKNDIIEFIKTYIPFNEIGEPWQVKDYQQVVLGLMWSKPYGIRCWSEPKKSGKSHITECVIIAECMLRAGTKVGIFANDSEQAESIIFKGATEVIKHNQALRESAKLLAKVIRFSNDSEIEWFAHDYEGGAGHRRRINVIDEPCFFEGERARRLYEELLPIPTIKDSYLWLSTTKGFSGESTFLEELYRRGIGGKRLSRKYELYEDKKYVMFWSHTPRQPWQTRPFYDEQRRLLRPATYLRQHENRWVSSESAFITREQWQACIDPSHRIALNRWVETYWGLDLGIKSDAAAIVGVCYDGGRIAIVDHRLWRPTKDEPVIISDVEEYLLSLRARFRIKQIHVDPWQAMSLIQRLQRTSLAGAIMEYPQTSQNLSIMTEELFRLITSRNLLAYDDKELQSHVLNAVTVESSRGIRLSKEKASRKIDLAISLAMACAAALQVGKPLASYAVPIGVGKVTNPFSDSRPRGETEIPRTRIPCPIGVGHSGWSLHSRDDDDDYYVGAKPVR